MHQTRPFARLPRHAAVALLLATAGLAIPACAASADGTADQPGASAVPAVVAEVGGKPITLSELEASISAQLAEIERQRRDLLEKGLERLIEERLIEAEAAARGTTASAMLAAEVEGQSGAITDEDAAAFYEENKARVGNRTLEQMMPQIKNYLANQRRATARDGLVSSLRSKYPTRIHLEPLRAEIATEGSPAEGPADAPVTIVEFSDFQCPYCARITPVLKEARAAYGDRVRIVFRHFPLSFHQQAQKAAEASMCAHDQGKFWELHDAMFANQRALQVEQIKARAVELGLDAGAFDTCLDSGKYFQQVRDDLAAGSAVGVSGTPAVFVNGRLAPGGGGLTVPQLSKIIEDELSRKGIDPKSAG